MKMQNAFSNAALALITIILIIAGTSLQAEDKKQSLYDRLGGVYNIATVVDDFVERLLINDTLNANAAINAARSIPKAGLKFQVTALVCQATGGAEQYKGRTMIDSHKHLNISETEWDVMMMDFDATLIKFKVPAQEKSELVAILESTKADIVTSQ